MLQKGGSFTHFAQKDYALFAALLDKQPINIGHWLFQEMSRFRFASRQTSHVPFPSLVSVILFYHRIWPRGASNDNIRRIPEFGQTQLNLMRLKFNVEGSGQSKAPSQSRATHQTSHGKEEEEVGSGPSQFPTDLEFRLKTVIDKAMEDFTTVLETEMQKLIQPITQAYDELSTAQCDIAASVGQLTVTTSRLVDKLDRLLQHQSSGAFGSAFGTAGPSFTSPPLHTPTPPPPASSPVPTTVTTAEQIPSPSNVILPTPASTLCPPSHTPIQFDPTPQSTTQGPLFEDDKGGEKSNDFED